MLYRGVPACSSLASFEASSCPWPDGSPPLWEVPPWESPWCPCNPSPVLQPPSSASLEQKPLEGKDLPCCVHICSPRTSVVPDLVTIRITLWPTIIYSLLCVPGTVLGALLKNSFELNNNSVRQWWAPLFKWAYWDAGWVYLAPKDHIAILMDSDLNPVVWLQSPCVYTCKQWSIHICWIQWTKGTVNAWFLLADFSSFCTRFLYPELYPTL